MPHLDAARHRRHLRWLPDGRTMPTSLWLRRHRAVTHFALLQAVTLGLVALIVGRGPLAALVDTLVVAVPALVATCSVLGRRLQTNATTVSLMLSSVVLVELWHGMTEAHFHFFVMVGVVALYQDWVAFAVCLFIVIVHHAVMGLLLPDAVFGSMHAGRPLEWALVHGAFVLAASVTHLLEWQANERQELSDPLTRLANRTAFLETLDRRLAVPNQDVSVLFIDLDNFKNINDSAGHHVGDLALKHAAQRMLAVMREGDLVARLGGDEFAVIVNGDAGEAESVGRRISAQLQEPVSADGREVTINASIGVADNALAGSRDSADLMRDADFAMYLAKSRGKNKVVVYTAGVDRLATARASLAVDVRQALAGGQFRLNFQPLMRGQNIFGVEALLRWVHPTRGALDPEEFVPVAEETGEIVAIGAWVLREATAQVAQWRRDTPGCEDLTLAVNLSPLQLRNPGLMATVSEALAHSDLPPQALTLEVTEGVLLSDLALARQQIDALRYLGVLIAIDDFGTGYSSLSYLAKLPADQIKIDKSFVRALADGPESVALVRAIIDVGHALNLDILAEGVEHVAQQAQLIELGCTATQGYLFSPPLTASGFEEFLGYPRRDFAA